MNMDYDEICKHIGAFFLNASQKMDEQRTQISQSAHKIQLLEEENKKLREAAINATK